MKKITFSLFILAAIFVSGTGCLKDKGFDNNEYGINDPDASPKGVGFLQGVKFVNPIGLNLTADPQTVETPLVISLLSAANTTSDVHVQVATDQSIVTQYNTDNAATANFVPLEVVDPSLFNLAGNDITIAAGEKLGTVVLNVPNATSFDPNTKYGIGVKITGADAGWTVATNEDEILLKISIKNVYDGKYELHGQFYHPTAAPSYPTFTVNVEMQTTAPNSVIMYSPDYDDFLHPWTATTGGSLTAFGSQSPEYTVDPGTLAISVQNAYVGAVTFYTMGLGFDNNGYDSRWDPTNKIMYDCFGYNNPGGIFNPAATRMWIDTLIYTGPR